MLTIQRASAGSGKTYTLARTYIQLLLTIKRPDGTPRLRTHAEVGDSLRHILAVTFTNKATAEMKQRIIDRLADLAAIENRPLPSDRKEWPDYLAEITDSTGAAPKEIAAAASCALRCILYSYSDFNVSTIDSFFQTILRTFAYETDLNDSYQLEIDSRASNAAGLDATLDAIANGEDRNASAWLKILMDRRIEDGQKWDPYQKGKSKFNFYNTLLKYAGRLESEQFKSARIALDNYFSTGTDLLAIYRQLDQKYREPAEKAFREMGRAAAKLKKSFDDANLDISVYGSGHLESRLRKALGKQFDIQPFKPSASPFSSKKDLREKIAGCKDKSIIEENYAAFREAAEAWKEAL
ncbi:MAG: UvrD-helicase domain-containing protein, partial [Muribaculaceae bacterium]|nr:UvrD-helicase domain-containing protein [Muribaculaceae bacterium]